MPEELNAIGGESIPKGDVERKIASVTGEPPETRPEDSKEQFSETANERYSEILSKVSPTAVTMSAPEPAQVEIDAKAVYDETDAEARVTKLLSLAETKGVEHAVRVARHLNDFYVLDRMHDELSGRFYEALKAKGLIDER